MSIDLPSDYRPSSVEHYMNPLQLEYFPRKLQRMRKDLLRQSSRIFPSTAATEPQGDRSDQASAETEHDLAALSQGRLTLLLAAVDQALTRIANGTYGFCADSGEPIGLRRLEAEPVATLSVEAEEPRERGTGRHSR